MKNLESQLKALANNRRLRILRFLQKIHKASVTDIAREIHLSFKSTSRHLAVLRSAEFVEKEQQSLIVFYSLANPLEPIVKQIINLG